MKGPLGFDIGSRSLDRVRYVFHPRQRINAVGRAPRVCAGRSSSPRRALYGVAILAATLALHYLDKLVLSDTGLLFNDLQLGVAGALLALLGAGSSLLSSQSARDSQASANKANKELAQYQYAKDLEMWGRANAYNHPSMQMARLRQAGLNPNMVYGSGSAVATGATQLPRYSAPKIEPLPSIIEGNAIGGAISQYQDILVKNQQVSNMEEQRKSIAAENDVLAGLVDSEERGRGVESLRRALRMEDLDKKAASALVGKAEWEKRRQEAYQKMPQYQADALRSQNSARAVQMQKMEADTKLTRMKIDYFAAQRLLEALGPIGKFFGMSRGAGSARSVGSARAVPKGAARVAPRVTPKTELGRVHPAYRVAKRRYGK